MSLGDLIETDNNKYLLNPDYLTCPIFIRINLRACFFHAGCVICLSRWRSRNSYNVGKIINHEAKEKDIGSK